MHHKKLPIKFKQKKVPYGIWDSTKGCCLESSWKPRTSIQQQFPVRALGELDAKHKTFFSFTTDIEMNPFYFRKLRKLDYDLFKEVICYLWYTYHEKNLVTNKCLLPAIEQASDLKVKYLT